MTVDDVQLVQRLRSHNQEAARELWRKYHPLIRSVVRSTVGLGYDIEDISQEVFLQFLRTLDGLRDPGALRSYLFGIAYRTAVRERRKRNVRKLIGLSQSGEVPEPPASEPDLAAREALWELYHVLDGLQPATRVAFLLRYVEGLQLKEIAAILGVSLSTAKRQVRRARDVVWQTADQRPELKRYLVQLRG